MVCTPTESADVVQIAAPVVSRGIVASGAVPSENITAPVGFGLPALETKALNVTGCPCTAGLGAETSCTTVAFCAHAGGENAATKLASRRMAWIGERAIN